MSILLLSQFRANTGSVAYPAGNCTEMGLNGPYCCYPIDPDKDPDDDVVVTPATVVSPRL